MSEFREDLGDSPKRAVARSLYRTYLGGWYTVTSRFDPGMNVYERDWDALVVLDGCRLDALREVAPEYQFLDADDIEGVWSMGCSSYEWLVKTFTETHREALTETAHVTADGFAGPAFEESIYAPSVSVPFGWPRRDVVGAEAFAELDHAWRRGHDDALGNVPPYYLTECAIDVGRSTEADRLVVHYDQPHAPYVARADRGNREPTEVELNPWARLRDGTATHEEIWGLYLDNLRYALDEVCVLLENYDADTAAITADHGVAFGELGIHGHPDGLVLPQIKKVPWVETTATDTGWRQPTVDRESGPEAVLEDSQSDLGYI